MSDLIAARIPAMLADAEEAYRVLGPVFYESTVMRLPRHVRDLASEVARLTTAIRHHRDQRGDDRCWLDDLVLYETLGEPPPDFSLMPECEFLESCRRFYRQRMEQAADLDPGQMTIQQLTDQVAAVTAERDEARDGQAASAAERDATLARLADAGATIARAGLMIATLRDERDTLIDHWPETWHMPPRTTDHGQSQIVFDSDAPRGRQYRLDRLRAPHGSDSSTFHPTREAAVRAAVGLDGEPKETCP